MKLEQLTSNQQRKTRKRVGRGIGSGMGKTSTRGQKGQNARSGGGVRPGFEGGQMPLFRRLPKRGFTNIWRTDYELVNVEDLNIFDEGTVIDREFLIEQGLVRRNARRVKVLGRGELTKKLTIKVDKISASAKEQVEKLGGSVEVI
ncbi:MAG: 50S ribosomal protein L15 [Tissierellia bacterium]|nr:50S ribosomal protein L15 [Tissierellia bacterium]